MGCDTWGGVLEMREAGGWAGDTVQIFLHWNAGRRWLLASWSLFWGRRMLRPPGCVTAGLLEFWVDGWMAAAAAWSQPGLCSRLSAMLCDCKRHPPLSGPAFGPADGGSKDSASGGAQPPLGLAGSRDSCVTL